MLNTNYAKLVGGVSRIFPPAGDLSAYTSATSQPSSSTYTYVII